MNRVGNKGKEESIWLRWLLHATLTACATLADNRDAKAHARWRGGGAGAGLLAEALDRDGWDGDWYRRAFFDDGTDTWFGEERRMLHRFHTPIMA